MNMNFQKSTWTNERVKTLKQLWGVGDSCSEIAASLGGVSRNAVIGKVHRLGLDRRTSSPSTRPGPKPSNTSKPQPTMKPKRTPPEEMDIVPDMTSLTAVESAPIPKDFLGIPLLKLKPGQCHYPRGDGEAILFCGQPQIESSSYCLACHKRCHTRPPRKPQGGHFQLLGMRSTG